MASYPIPITVTRNKKTRNLALRIYIGSAVGLRAPVRLSDKKIIDFITEKNDWLQTVVRAKRENAIQILGADDANHLFQTSAEHYKKHKTDSLELISEALPDLNINNWPYEKVTVKDTKTRWGSCSTKNNLNFNYKILFLPPNLQDYLMIHELCHIKHHNHSRDFWSQVERQVPNYKNLDKQLRSL